MQVYLGVIQNRAIEIDGYRWPIDSLIIATSNPGLRLIIVRASDVPTYVEYGAADLGIAGKDGRPPHDYDTTAIFTPERFGQWLHLATVIDPSTQEVRHYLNGDLIAKLTRKGTFPVRLTVAELGNWNDGGRHDRVAIRHFSVVMDEFLLFNRALSVAEIARLAE